MKRGGTRPFLSCLKQDEKGVERADLDGQEGKGWIVPFRLVFSSLFILSFMDKMKRDDPSLFLFSFIDEMKRAGPSLFILS